MGGDPMAILIVEDNPLNRRIFQVRLETCGFKTVQAANGAEALQVLGETPEVELVLTDVRMPEMDGWQLIAELRGRPAWADLPVIVTSAYADLPSVQRAKELGIKSFVVKPINAELLMREVQRALSANGARLTRAETVMNRLQFTRAEYETVLKDFAQELERATATLEGVLAQNPIVAPDPAAVQQLSGLQESCEVAGAERAVNLLARMSVDFASDVERACRALLRECLLVQRAVGDRIGAPRAGAAKDAVPAAS